MTREFSQNVPISAGNGPALARRENPQVTAFPAYVQVAEADGNRTRQRRGTPLTGFEDQGGHQAPRRLRRRLYLTWPRRVTGRRHRGTLPAVLADNNPWWADAVVYQVYPRSFADSNGAGIGDLDGLTSRLPYLSELGVDALWLTPFYPSPLADGGYDVSDYRDVDPRLGTLAGFDALVARAREHGMRVIVDLVPNHCSAAHPLFQAALAAGPGSQEREMFIFRPGRGPGGDLPPKNWPSNFGGSAWTRVPDGQWYLHLFDAGQPDWNWRDPRVPRMFEDIIRFWLDRGVAGLRVDVAHGIFKDPELPDDPDPDHLYRPVNAPSAYHHRPELQQLYRSWRAILDSYPADGFPGARTAVGEVWADTPGTLRPYLESGGLPQVFNFELIVASWDAAGLRQAIDGVLALADGSRAPWVIGNHDAPRPVSRYARDDGFGPA